MIQFIIDNKIVDLLFIALTGCLLTIILLMRALDPLGYEKETLGHFQTLKVRTYSIQSFVH